MTVILDLAAASVAELLSRLVPGGPARMHALVAAACGLEQLARAEPFEIAAWLDGIDPDANETPKHRSLRRAEAIAAAFELGRRVEVARVGPRPRITSAAEVAAWASPRIGALPHEELWMLAVDGRGCLRAARCVAKGGLHGAAVRAADPLRAAIRVDASAFVLVHNHPSGDPTPSREDVLLTEQIGCAAELVGVPLLDHVVVAREGFACVPRALQPVSSSVFARRSG